MRARGKVSKTIQREQPLVFAAIAVFTTCAVLAPVLLAMLSSRPDLYAVKTKPVRPGVSVVDWQTLGSLLSAAADPAAARPGWFGPEVQIALLAPSGAGPRGRPVSKRSGNTGYEAAAKGQAKAYPTTGSNFQCEGIADRHAAPSRPAIS